MKNKMQKVDMEFIKFDTEDVITTSGGGDTFNMADKSQTNTYGNAHDSTGYSSGTNSLWNKSFQ